MHFKFLFYLILSFGISFSSLAQNSLKILESERSKISINQGWKFHLGNPTAEFYNKDHDDSAWETVHIPHSLKLTSLNLDDSPDDKMQATFHRTVGWYRRSIEVTPSGRKVFLEFEGAHQVTDLWINGTHVGQHAIGGYTPFHFDITNYIKKGDSNQITLLVDNRKKNHVPPDPGPFDYIKFSGLYRDVYLVETSPIRILFNWEDLDAGVTFTTPSVDPVNGNATIAVKTMIKNESSNQKTIKVVNRIIDNDGLVVLKLEQTKNIKPGMNRTFNQIGGIEVNINLWSIDDPYLYRLNTMVYLDNHVVDATECAVGIRKFEHHPREGFLLNGEPIKLIGMNRHQNFAYIGDAAPDALHYKDMLQLKELGFNVVRTAHYPQDNAVIDACDQLGMLVYEEAPTWIGIGNDEWFDNLEKATRVMIRNHRNHPSVVLWGAGINHRGYVPRMHYAAKQEDPTRLTVSQSSRWTGWQTSGLTDIYGQMVYGPVEWYRHEPMLAMEGRDGIEALKPYMQDPLLTGIIAWAAHDHYTFHPANKTQRGRVRPVGIMGIFRIPYRETNFYPIELKDKSGTYIATDWNNQTNEVLVFSNSDEVDLLINNKLLKTKKAIHRGLTRALRHPPFRFQIAEYEPGKLTARGRTGEQVDSDHSIFTKGIPESIEVVIDTAGRRMVADGSDIITAYANIIDKNGMLIEDADYNVTFSVDGPASIVGDKLQIGANPMMSWKGTAAVLIKAGLNPGKITLSAKANNLEGGKAVWQSIRYDPSSNLAKLKPFVDVESVKIDLGSANQLLQFDWLAWNGKDGSDSNFSCNKLGGFQASLKTISQDGLLRWLGEMNVMGKYGYAIGEGVMALDQKGVILELQNLAAGKYQIITYHHAPKSNTDSMDPNKINLKTLKLTDVPFAKSILAELNSKQKNSQRSINITEGKLLSEHGPSSSVFNFTSDGKESISIRFSSLDTYKNIWLNGIELKRFIE